MFTHILVAVDGSPPAERVLPHAIALAGLSGAAVTLLRATAPAGQVMAEAGPLLDPTPVVEAEQQEASQYLELLARRVRDALPGFAVTCEDAAGPPAEVIIARARALGADLIGLTTSRPGVIERVLFGSVADAVLRGAPCPVLLVPVE